MLEVTASGPSKQAFGRRERQMGLRDGLASDDDDGDGLTFYEEYRGFMTDEGFARTDPRVSDR